MPTRGVYNRIMPINCVQTITGYGGLVLYILRYLRAPPIQRTIRVRANIYAFLARCNQNCDRATTRLVVALVRNIVRYPEQDNYKIALPIIIDLVDRFANTGSDRQILTYFRALAHCLAT